MYNDNSSIYKVSQLDITQSDGFMDLTDSKEGESCIKKFPTFDNGREIFKPLSKQKPRMTEMFAVAEVFAANLAEFLGYDHAQYQLAECRGLSTEVDKYLDKGVITTNFLQNDQQIVTLLDYYRQHPTAKLDMQHYINFAFCVYDLDLCFNEEPFKNNPELTEDFVSKMLFKYLIVDNNAHFGNMGMIKDEKRYHGLPLFDNEYSNFFINLNNDIQRQGYYNTYMRFARKKIEKIKDKFPKVFKDFQYRISDIKDRNFLVELCDFSGLSKFVEDYNSFKYDKCEVDPEPYPATSEALQNIGEKMYNEFNNHVDTLLEM